MSDQQRHESNGGFEREDLSAKTIYGFLIGLAVLGILVFLVVTGMYRALNGYDEAHQAARSPLKPPAVGDTRDVRTSKVTEKIGDTFPQPLLETDERNELTDFRTKEEIQLNSYGWMDPKAGVVHIPIERAMQLLAERGLPVRPSEANSVSPAKSGNKTAANKAVKQ